MRLSLKISDPSTLAKEIFKREKISCAELRSETGREVVKARRLFCQMHVKKRGYSGAEVARFLGLRTSGVNRLAASEELPDLVRYT